MALILNKIRMNFILVLFPILLLGTKSIWCDDWEYNLVRNLLKGYDSSIRPSTHHNISLNVTFGLSLAQIIDVDERNMIITSNCWLNQGWIDYKLKWDPDMYDGIKSIHIPADRIWKPDILLVNNADSWAKMASISTNVIVQFNGNVTWLSTVIFKSSCSILVKYFPFDEQICDMIFASWTFDGYFLDISLNTNEGDLTNFIKNGEWHLVELSATKYLRNYSCCEYPYPEIYYKLRIRRRPLYYVFNMVFPCLLITLVAFLGFFLPPDSSEKVSIGITTLLSLTVFLTLVAESLPPTSEQLPLLGIYYFITIGIVSFSTFMAVVTLNINNKGNKGKRLPRLVKIIFFKYLARLLGTELQNYMKKANHQNILLINKKQTISGYKLSNDELNKELEYDKGKNVLHLSSNHIGESGKSITSKEKNFYELPRNQSNQYIPQRSEGVDPIVSNFKNINNNNNNNNSNKFKQRSDGILLKTRKDSFLKSLECDKSYFNILNNYDTNKNLNMQCLENLYSSHRISSPILNPCNCKYVCECEQNYANRKTKNSSNKNTTETDISLNSINQSATNNEIVMDSKGNSFLIKNNYEPLRKLSKNPCSCQSKSEFTKGHKRKKSLISNNFQANFLLELDKTLEKQFKPLVFSVNSTIEKNEKRQDEKALIDKIQGEWQDLALVCDHFLCYFFPFMTLTVCLLIFVNSPHVFSQW